MLKDMDFYHLLENIENNYWMQNQILKQNKIENKIRNKIADAITKSNDDKIVKQEPVEEIIIPLEKEIKY